MIFIHGHSYYIFCKPYFDLPCLFITSAGLDDEAIEGFGLTSPKMSEVATPTNINKSNNNVNED